MASESNDFPIACVAVINAVFGKTKEYLSLSADVRIARSLEDLPSHIELDMMFWVIRPHNLPMSSKADDEEPDTQPP